VREGAGFIRAPDATLRLEVEMNSEDIEWCRKHMAKYPFEPMVAAMGVRSDRYGVCAIAHLTTDPNMTAADEYGVDRFVALV